MVLLAREVRAGFMVIAMVEGALIIIIIVVVVVIACCYYHFRGGGECPRGGKLLAVCSQFEELTLQKNFYFQINNNNIITHL